MCLGEKYVRTECSKIARDIKRKKREGDRGRQRESRVKVCPIEGI